MFLYWFAFSFTLFLALLFPSYRPTDLHENRHEHVFLHLVLVAF